LTQQQYYYGTGRRKTAVARVRVVAAPGAVTVNGKPVEEVFPVDEWHFEATKPLVVTRTEGQVTVTAKTSGGGAAGQAGAVSLGIARALVSLDPGLKKALKDAGLLTRDARAKESKHYGLKRARKAPQYTKR
jgi:small subunit ribosomal protein S9